MWFDRGISYDSNGEEGMKDRCTDCGKATDEVPTEEQLKEFKALQEKLKEAIDKTDIPF